MQSKFRTTEWPGGYSVPRPGLGHEYGNDHTQMSLVIVQQPRVFLQQPIVFKQLDRVLQSGRLTRILGPSGAVPVPSMTPSEVH